MRLLYYGESPLNPTGFGTVNRHILRACAKVADEVTVVASTHFYEDYDHDLYPYKIIGCDPDGPRDLFAQRNLAEIEKELKELNWDVFIIQTDMGAANDILEWAAIIQRDHPEKQTIFYMPIDGDISLGFAFNPFSWCSAPVVYTNHAKSVIHRYAPEIAEKVSVIWLGCETDTFFPLSPEEKKKARLDLFGPAYEDRFLICNVGRNQVRKDMARCMAAFHQFHLKHDDASLYMHSVQNDSGGSLAVQAMLVGCDVRRQPAEIIFSDLDLAHPWSRSTLNTMYNACDLLVSTAYGEGWGLTTTEAMAAGTPVMVPAGTANLDILGDPLPGKPYFERERGWGIKTGGDLDHTSFIYQNGGGPVPHVHLSGFLETLEYIYNHREEAQEKALEALKWCRANTWKHQEEKWEQLLRLMKSEMEKSSSMSTTAS